jgi:hypothetical protein
VGKGVKGFEGQAYTRIGPVGNRTKWGGDKHDVEDEESSVHLGLGV